MKIMMALVGSFLLIGSGMAQAALGEQVDSVANDSSHFHAQLSSVAREAYSVHTLTQSNGTEIKEFTSPSGVVFAVSWQGSGRPDLQQLLGSHFAVLKTELAARTFRQNRSPVSISHSDLVLHLGGHMRMFTGYAYLPQQLPATVQPSDLR